MELTARFNGPPMLTGKAMLVLCSYRGGAGRKQPWMSGDGVIRRIIGSLTLLPLRQFIAMYRDHFANPRNFSYQLALAQAVLENARFTGAEILVDAALNVGRDDIELIGVEKVAIETIVPAFFTQGNFDTIVLIYPDALGLSWSRIEARAMVAARTVVLVNGRRRLFTLDQSVRKSLLWRRFLANTRFVEILMGIGVIPVAAILALIDRLRRRG